MQLKYLLFRPIDLLLLSKYWEKVKWELAKDLDIQENDLLKLNSDKALTKLSWEPVWDFKETINQTVSWYKSFYESKNDLLKISKNQILNYTSAASLKKIQWANAK